jgi:hypothetical protein
MNLGDIVKITQPWGRMKISGLAQVDNWGKRIWSQTLTEAQKLAYWEHEIMNYIIDEKDMTVYCILREG